MSYSKGPANKQCHPFLAYEKAKPGLWSLDCRGARRSRRGAGGPAAPQHQRMSRNGCKDEALDRTEMQVRIRPVRSIGSLGKLSLRFVSNFQGSASWQPALLEDPKERKRTAPFAAIINHVDVVIVRLKGQAAEMSRILPVCLMI